MSQVIDSQRAMDIGWNNIGGGSSGAVLLFKKR
jgi:hypothetical protein